MSNQSLPTSTSTTSNTTPPLTAQSSNVSFSDAPLLSLLGMTVDQMDSNQRREFIKHVQTLRTSQQTLKARVARDSKAEPKSASGSGAGRKGCKQDPTVDLTEYLNL